MAVQIPFPLPAVGFALNSKMRINLDFLVDQFNQFNTGTATWDNVSIGTANNLTGTLTLYNASNANYLTFQAGATAINTTFTLPTGVPSVNRKFLTSTTGGAMSWSNISEAASYVGNQLLYIDGANVIQELSVGSGNKVLVNSTPPSFFTLTGTANQITVTPSAGAFTFSLPQSIDTAANVQFGSVQTGGGSATNPAVRVIYSGAATNTGIWSASGTELDFTVAGINRGAIDNTGVLAMTGGLNAPAIRATTAVAISTASSHIVTIQSGATSDYTLTLPVDAGTNNYVLKTNGSGVLSWVSVGSTGGATTALDNLAAVAINTSLLPGADNTIDLGSSTKDFKDLYMKGAIKYGSTTILTPNSSGYGSFTSRLGVGGRAPIKMLDVGGAPDGLLILVPSDDLNTANDIVQLTTAGLSNLMSISKAGNLYLPNGSASLPSHSFQNDKNTGWYGDGSDSIRCSIGGTQQFKFASLVMQVIASGFQIQGDACSATAPSFSFAGDANTGLFSLGADQLGFATGGSVRLNLTTTELRSVVDIVAAGGANNLGSASDTWLRVYANTVSAQSGSAGAASFIMGADAGANTLTNATTKRGQLAMPHYNSSSVANFAMVVGVASSTDNTLQFGGGSTTMTGATSIQFCTASSITATSGGTLAMTIDSSQNVTIGGSTANPNLYVNSSSGAQFRVLASGSTAVYVQTQSAHPMILTTDNGSDGIRITNTTRKSVVIGDQALATNATDGFLYIPSCAGTPTGVPTAYTGRVALCYNSSGDVLYIYNSPAGTGWRPH